MEKPQKDQSTTPPYVAYKTLKNFLRSLSQAIPSRIDKSVMTSLAGGTQSQLLHALKYLGLTNATGTPTEKLPLLIKSEGAEYQKILRDILHTAYPFLESKQIDLKTATMHQLEEQFGSLATGDTVRKCVTFFIPAAKDAGIQLSPFIKEPGKRSPSTKTKKVRQNSPKTGIQEHHDEIPPMPPQTISWHELLLSKFPSFDPSWPDEVKAKWFESFNELMQRGQEKK